MNVYKTILLSDSTSELSARAVYSLAYFYDLIYSNVDSALKYYEILQSYHPESEQAVVSKQRLLAINNFFNDSSEAENDSLEIEENKRSVPSTKTLSLDSIPTNIKRSFSILDSTINIMNADTNNVSRDTTVLKK